MSERNAEIYYYDIGDYLSREQKLNRISQFKSMENLPFTRITSNEHGDWISKRNDRFETWIPIEADKKFNNTSQSFFTTLSPGIVTSRDSWIYNFSKTQLAEKISNMIKFYSHECNKNELPNKDSAKISWSVNLLKSFNSKKEISFSEDFINDSMYRPFCKQKIYYQADLIERKGNYKSFLPSGKNNYLIIIQGASSNKGFSPFITDSLPDFQTVFNSQCFPLYWYETIEPKQHSLFGDDGAKIVRHEAISDFILDRARQKYGNKVQKEDIFYYVYGILHSKSYRETFSADLKKMLPRIPLVSDWQKFWAFSEAGRELANLHLNYEKVAPSPDVQVDSLKYAQYASDKQSVYADGLMVAKPAQKNRPQSETDYEYYAVEQMKFPKKGEKSTILYNHWHTIKNIPEKAYEYVVNGKSAIEWIMERYAVTTDKKSGIKNDPNDWSREHQKPRYILDLLLSVINVSVQTVDIVNGLPEVDWDKE